MVIRVDESVMAAIEKLGPKIVFFTPRARPLKGLDQREVDVGNIVADENDAR